MRTRAVLLVTLAQEASLETREALRLVEPLREFGQLTVWLSAHEPHTALDLLHRALASGQVHSAALLTELPDVDRTWLAVEWRGRLVVQRKLLQTIQDSTRWKIELEHEGAGVFVLVPTGQDKRKVARSAAAFRQALHSPEPVVAPFRIPERLEDHRSFSEWFGGLSDESVGGAMALMTLSGATRPGQEILLRNPAALGLELNEELPALSSYLRTQQLRMLACGTSDRSLELPRTMLEAFVGPQRNELDAVQKPITAFETELREASDLEQGGFLVLLCLEAPSADPEIVIPTGTVFEQTALNGVQTLASARPRRLSIDPGQFVPVALPAWCLNRNLRAPRGERVRTTPLRYKGDGSQEQVWEDMAERLRATVL